MATAKTTKTEAKSTPAKAATKASVATKKAATSTTNTPSVASAASNPTVVKKVVTKTAAVSLANKARAEERKAERSNAPSANYRGNKPNDNKNDRGDRKSFNDRNDKNSKPSKFGDKKPAPKDHTSYNNRYKNEDNKPETNKNAKEVSRAPQLNVIDGLCKQMYPTFSRAFSELERMQPKANGTQEFAQDFIDNFNEFVKRELTSSYPQATILINDEDDIPEEGVCWVVQISGGKENLAHARNDACVMLGYIVDGRPLLNVIWFPILDEKYITEMGKGTKSSTMKLRVSGRAQLKDSIVNVNSVKHCLAKLTKAGILPRIGGNSIVDILDVASGRADACILTDIPEPVAVIGEFILLECGATVTDSENAKVSDTSTSLMAGNDTYHKLLNELVN